MLETLYEPPVAEDPTPAPLASLDYILADSRTRADGPVTYVDISRYGRADARVHRLARPGRGRDALRHQRLRRAEPGLPRPAGAGRHRALGRRHALRADVSAALRPLRRHPLQGGLGRARGGDVLRHPLGLPALGAAARGRARSGAASAGRCRSPATACRSACWPRPTASSCRAPAGDPFWWTPVELRARRGGSPSRSASASPDDDRLGRSTSGCSAPPACALPVLRLATGGMDWAEALLARQTDVLTVDLLLLVAGASSGCACARGRRGAGRGRAGAGRVSVLATARRHRRSASPRSATSRRPTRSAAAPSGCRRPRGGAPASPGRLVLLPGAAGAGLERGRRLPRLVRRHHRRRLGPGRDLPATGRRLACARRGGRRGGPPGPDGAAHRRARSVPAEALPAPCRRCGRRADRLGALERRVEELEAEVAALRRGRPGGASESVVVELARPAGRR